MKNLSLMQQVLGAQWEQLPSSLKAHYSIKDNKDVGNLSIEYPRWMQLYLNLLRHFGALVNRRGENIPAIVEKSMQGGVQIWKRCIRFGDGKEIMFESRWEFEKQNQLIEYVNPIMGLRMNVRLEDEVLYYCGMSLVLKIGRFKLPIPESLVLGHTEIIEKAIDESNFQMDFTLRHPVLGLMYRYHGCFSTKEKSHVSNRET